MARISLTENVSIDEEELDLTGIRAQGAGGQNVNKVSSAVHLRFSVAQSSLPEEIKERLLNISDKRLSKDGVIVIKAQRFRTQEKNRADAIERLSALVATASVRAKTRRPTKPSRSAKRKRVDSKVQRGQIKSLRGRVDH